ncbi:Protein N-acetyltransferase, RimJ/RimL family [Salegentibacter echinorum]|uniref:Protein N-acetyltransferase, RimJ/RimL family n=1 Tax=Salegentibacter echinorum TaxID=1073325 RepID=A0A1M5FFS1_SALEC|nr:GNAT family N-acetyltransferase [Salegentibacter echinorum]SHF90325.1 Protein N-acetyltransferase, RimJ/RimL family [Salegentibacter echinorum]
MNSYKVLNKQSFSSGEYKIVPIRMEDRYAIMQWRNEQMYHLRQNEVLTKEKQDYYFDTVVSKLFEQEKPDQILFSYLKEEECIGYGGLVHINWIDRNAEISFIMNTELEERHFEFHWNNFFKLLEEVAWKALNLHKIFTYAFDLRPKLYTIFEKQGFHKEARLREHILSHEKAYLDVVIHSKINKKL